MRFSPIQNDMLSSVRNGFEKEGDRTLFEIGHNTENGIMPLKLIWMTHAGPGQSIIGNLTPKETEAAKKLLSSGHITYQPQLTFEKQVVRQLRLLEHLNWLIITNRGFVIVEHGARGKPDTIIRPDETYDAAILALQTRIKDGDAAPARSLTQLKPNQPGAPAYRIIFGRDNIEEDRRRQKSNILPFLQPR